MTAVLCPFILETLRVLVASMIKDYKNAATTLLHLPVIVAEVFALTAACQEF